MIGSLRGRLAAKQAPHIVIECQGVGYEVETPMSTFLELPAIGEELFVHTHLLVREDAQLLYGFASEAERSLFRTVLKISGVGAKMGLAILSAMSEADFRREAAGGGYGIDHRQESGISRIAGHAGAGGDSCRGSRKSWRASSQFTPARRHRSTAGSPPPGCWTRRARNRAGSSGAGPADPMMAEEQ